MKEQPGHPFYRQNRDKLGALGIGLVRTQTLANGDDKCDFRVRWGAETPSGWPLPWLEAEK